MIYILKFYNNSIKKYYGLDEVIDFALENNSFEELMKREKNSRIGVLNFPETFRNLMLQRNYPLIFVDEVGESLDFSYKLSSLSPDFFRRDAKEVALGLLGKIMVRKIGKTLLLGKILETEAYYGDKDPASRAYRGKRNYNRGMWKPGGHVFVYMVHANWMFNITTDDEEAQAVLVRAVEPLFGLEFMYEKRGRKIRELCNGPGKWTRAFGIGKELNEKPLGKDIMIVKSPWNSFEVRRSHRIGVTRDLEEPLRFFIPSRYTSNNRAF